VIKADNFRNDPYGWLTNQCGHVLLGIVGYIAVVFGLLWHLGEFPERELAWAIVLIAYLAWEFAIQRGNNLWDSLEDTIFVAAYGAGTLALAFREVDPIGHKVQACFYDILPMIAFLAFHLFAGVIFRLWGRRKE
jgi:hypothetical protein